MHKQRVTTISKALLTAGLLGGAALSTLGAGSAQAADGRFDCSFGGTTTFIPLCSDINWTVGWTLADKKLTNLMTAASAPASGDFSFIYNDFGTAGLSVEDIWTTVASFNPDLPDPVIGSYSYNLAIDPVLGAGWRFNSVELDVDHAGTGQVVTKTIVGGGNPVLTSTNGMPVGPVPLSGTSIQVTDSWNLVSATGTVMAISNTYTQTTSVPGPLPLLGVGAALGFSRKLRKRINGSEQLG